MYSEVLLVRPPMELNSET